MLQDIARVEQPLPSYINQNLVSEKTTNNAKLTWACDRVRSVPLPVSQELRASRARGYMRVVPVH